MPFLPAPTLPRGGGAIRGIGEKVSVNPGRGTCGVQVPVFVSPGRPGATPALSLAYDAGAGNTPFGVGWTLEIASIARSTDKGLPTYSTADVFVLAGQEELVPTGPARPATVEGVACEVQRYRPRVDNAFTRIERCTPDDGAAVFWRTVSRDNVVSLFRTTIADPQRADHVFRWLLDLTRDDHGNVTTYEYTAETTTDLDPALPWERNRRGSTAPQRYLHRIRYANRTPGGTDHTMFVELEYADTPRPDAFSSYRSGFDVRTWRLCTRILMYHDFAAEDLGPGPTPRLVRSTDLRHDGDPAGVRLIGLTQTGYAWVDGAYQTASLPAVEFEYTRAAPEARVRVVEATNLPSGVDGSAYRWVDLDGDGLPGVLSRQGGSCFYARNLGSGRLAPVELVSPVPALSNDGTALALVDVAADGSRALVRHGPSLHGYQERVGDGWGPFTAFAESPVLDWADPGLRQLDLDGDGLTDLLYTGTDEFGWHRSLGRSGYGPRLTAVQPRDEEAGPVVGGAAAADEAVLVADMSGDGLPDLVRVRSGEVCYWPNLGHGRFGAKVSMGGAPVFDHPDQFDPTRLRTADIDGSGTTDFVYIGRDRVTLWANLSGNQFGAATVLAALPDTDRLETIEVVDLLGTGTACLVWSSAKPADAGQPLRYVDLNRAVSDWLPAADAGQAGHKPGLLAQVRNNMGAVSRIVHAPSTRFSLADRAAGSPWSTRLPFPVHVVQRIEAYDTVLRTQMITGYRYRHGYCDPDEREFRGFGMVEQVDAEAASADRGAGLFSQPPGPELDRPPARQRSWFHLGAAVDLAHEWFGGDPLAINLDDCVLPAEPTALDWRESLRALAGRPLWTEFYADDGDPHQDVPYVTEQHRYQVALDQPSNADRHAVLRSFELESVSHHYERASADPRVTHQLNLAVDQYNTVLSATAFAYPRRNPAIAEQASALATLSYTDVVHTDTPDTLRLGTVVERRQYEVTGVAAPADLRSVALAEIAFEATPTPGTPQRRLMGRTRTAYWDDGLTAPLPYGQVGQRALVQQTQQAAFTPGLVSTVYAGRVSPAMLTSGRHVLDDGLWWIPSGVQHYDPGAFYAPSRLTTPFGNESSVEYDGYRLLPTIVHQSLSAPLDVLATAFTNDYRVLAPILTTDANGSRTSVAFDPLGRVVALWAKGPDGSTDGDPDSLPGAVFDYDLSTVPVHSRGRTRERHGDASARWQEARVWTDGSGRAALTKALAEPGPALTVDGHGQVSEVDTGQQPRWLATGRTVFDHKGQPVKQYEPYYTASGDWEDEPTLGSQGVTPIWHYDPIGRLIRTEHPDGTESRVVVQAWRGETWDTGDTVLQSRWYADRGSPGIADPEPTDPDQRAAWLTAAQAATPTVTHYDPAARAVRAVADGATDGLAETRSTLDILGNVRAVTDPRGVVVSRQDVDLTGRVLHAASPDSGERWTLPDAAGAPIRQWDSRGHDITLTYDLLRRPVARIVGGVVTDLHFYGEGHPSADARNLHGRPFLRLDPSGAVVNLQFDFKGNLLSSRRQLGASYTATADWSSLTAAAVSTVEAQVAPLLEAEVFSTATDYDALNRPVLNVLPDGTMITPDYHVSGRLRTMAARNPGETADSPYVKALTYNAKGQRLSIVYGNEVRTDYTYDPYDDRLRTLVTLRGNEHLQDLTYYRDALGAITEIRDNAAETVFFAGKVAPPVSLFRYDALHRLVQATGREHASLTGQVDRDEPSFAPLPHPNDPQALRPYTQTYTYDLAGNLTVLAHQAGVGSWTRTCTYAPDSNRLLQHTTSTGPAVFGYDAHGNMSTLPHLNGPVGWTDADQLGTVDLGGGGTAYYRYDGDGQRVRRVLVRPGGLVEERIYLGGYELHRKRLNGTVTFQRSTVHLVDDARRIAMIETQTVDQRQLRVRYQLGNHLGSCALEVSDTAQVISYEEYHPYGTTSLWLGGNGIEASDRRYRYIGKEKDDETGLYYHGARYYLCWLGRWTAPDPAGLTDGTNRYAYVRNNPVQLADPGGRWGAEEEAARRAQNRLPGSLSPDEIADVYQRPPENLVAPDTPHFHEKVRAALHRGKVKRAAAKQEAKAHPPATTEEQNQAALDGARNWVLDKLTVSPTTAGLLPMLIPNALLGHYVLQPLKVPEPSAFPRNLHDYQLRENYDFAQGTMTVTEIGVTFAIGPILESAQVLRAPSLIAPTVEGGSVGAAMRNDWTVFTPPGEFVPVLRGGKYMEALEAQNLWSGQSAVYAGDNIMLWEYRSGDVMFDSARINPLSGDLEALQEFKYDYSGTWYGNRTDVITKLNLQADAQLLRADELGVQLEWHVPRSQLGNFRTALGPAKSSKITWALYDLGPVQQFLRP
jgi:RHS repeat-associated protein